MLLEFKKILRETQEVKGIENFKEITCWNYRKN